MLNHARVDQRLDQPISTSSEKFSESNYGLVAYTKTADWLASLEQKNGPALQLAIRSYYDNWKFRHPYPEDFREELLMQSFHLSALMSARFT